MCCNKVEWCNAARDMAAMVQITICRDRPQAALRKGQLSANSVL